MPRYKNILPHLSAHTQKKKSPQTQPNRLSAAINYFLPNGYTRTRDSHRRCKYERFRELCARAKRSLLKIILHRRIPPGCFAPHPAYTHNPIFAYILTCRVRTSVLNNRRTFRKAPSGANRFQIRASLTNGFASPTISNSAHG